MSTNQVQSNGAPRWAVPIGAAGGATIAAALLVALRASGIRLSATPSIGIVAGAAGIGGYVGFRWQRQHSTRTSQHGAIGDEPALPLRIAQLNAHNLFDTVDDRQQDDVVSPAELQLKLDKLAHAIADDLDSPDIVAMEEVENLAVLERLAGHPLLAKGGYRAVLLEGSDPRGIDVGVLYRDTSVGLSSATQLNTMVPSGASGRLTKLFTRPPLVARFDPVGGAVDAAEGVTLLVNHFTSKLGGADADVRRLAQAQFVDQAVATMVGLDPSVRALVVGDLNAGEGEPAYQALMDASTGAGLVDVTLGIPPDDRFTYIFRAHRDKLDHMFASPALAEAIEGATILHSNTSASEEDRMDPTTGRGASDHDPLVATFAINRLIGPIKNSSGKGA